MGKGGRFSYLFGTTMNGQSFFCIWEARMTKLVKSRLLCAGCPRVAGDNEENFDADDFDDEFPIKIPQHSPDRDHVATHSVI